MGSAPVVEEPKAAPSGVADDNGDKKKKETPKVPYRDLFRYATRQDKIMTGLSCVFGAIGGAGMPMFSLIFGELLDAYQDDDIVDSVREMSLYLVYLSVGLFVVSYIQVAFANLSAEQQALRIREEYMKSLLKQDQGYFDTHDAREVSSRLTEDIQKIQLGMGDRFANVWNGFGCFIAGLVLAFIEGPIMSLVILGCMPPMAIAMGLFAVQGQKMTAKATDAYAKAGAVASEAFSMIRAVVAFGGERAESTRYQSHLGDAAKIGTQVGLYTGLSMGGMWFFMMAAYGVGLWYGATRIVDDLESGCTGDDCYTGGRVVTIFFSVIIGAMQLGTVAPNATSMAEAQAAAVKVFETIDRPSAIDATSDAGATPEACNGRLELRNVTFEYPSRPGQTVLRSVSLTVNPGETVALVGGSGAGKSSVVRLFQRLYDPVEGSVCLDGTDVRELNLKWMRSKIGLVSQEPVLFSRSISENIALGAHGTEVSQEDVERVAAAANAHGFISGLPKGYATLVGERGADLSGGQKQRVAIARAIIRDPKILLLDEATSALDTESERQVQTALDQLLSSNRQLTTVVIAHRLSTVRNADRIVVFDSGEIVEEGTHEELVGREGGTYAKLWGLQQLEGVEGGAAAREDALEGKDDDGAAAAGAAGDETVTVAIEDPSTTVADTTAVQEVERDDADYDEKGRKLTEEEKEQRKKMKLPSVPFGRVWAFQKDNTLSVIHGLFWCAICGGAMPVWAILFSEMLGVLYSPDPDTVSEGAVEYALWFVGIGAALFVSHALAFWIMAYVSEELTTKLRVASFKAVVRQEIGFFDSKDNAPGSLAARLFGDAALVRATMGDKLSQQIIQISSFVVGIAIAFTASWHVASVILGISPLIFLSAIIQWKIMTGMNSGKEKAAQEAGQIATEALVAIPTVSAFGLQGEVFGRFSKAVTAPLKEGKKQAHVAGLGFGFSMFSMFIAYAVVFWIGSYFIQEGWTDFTNMNKAFFAIVMGAMGAGNTSAMAADAAKAEGAKRSIFALLDRTSSINHEAQAPTTHKPAAVGGKLELKDVTFSYPTRSEQTVLKGVNLTINAGESVALVGPSGHGKSTVMALLQRWYDPASGSIELDGKDLKSYDVNYLRSHMSLVAQEPQLFQDSIQYNIAYGRGLEDAGAGAVNARTAEVDGKPVPDLGMAVDAKEGAATPAGFVQDEAVAEAARHANAHDFISGFEHGYATNVGEGGGQLSGGQKQRVAIARAIIRNPKILLLDEATSALDTESEAVVQAALDQLLEETRMEGRTTVVIAHRLSTVQKCDKIAVIEGGVVAEVGTHEELLSARGAYYGLVTAQMSKK